MKFISGAPRFFVVGKYRYSSALFPTPLCAKKINSIEVLVIVFKSLRMCVCVCVESDRHIH